MKTDTVEEWSDDQWATIARTAGKVDVCTRTVRRWIADGKVEAARVGPRCVRVRWGSVRALLEGAGA